MCSKCKITEETIELYVMGQLSQEEAALLEGHLLGCSECRLRLEQARWLVPLIRAALRRFLETCSSAGVGERRRETRFNCRQIVDLHLGTGPAIELAGEVVDISESGLGLETKRSVEVGTPVEVISGDVHLCGTVRHCSYLKRSYRLGITFDQDERWSPLDYVPDGLAVPPDTLATLVGG